MISRINECEFGQFDTNFLNPHSLFGLGQVESGFTPLRAAALSSGVVAALIGFKVKGEFGKALIAGGALVAGISFGSAIPSLSTGGHKDGCLVPPPSQTVNL